MEFWPLFWMVYLFAGASTVVLWAVYDDSGSGVDGWVDAAILALTPLVNIVAVLMLLYLCINYFILRKPHL